MLDDTAKFCETAATDDFPVTCESQGDTWLVFVWWDGETEACRYQCSKGEGTTVQADLLVAGEDYQGADVFLTQAHAATREAFPSSPILLGPVEPGAWRDRLEAFGFEAIDHGMLIDNP